MHSEAVSKPSRPQSSYPRVPLHFLLKWKRPPGRQELNSIALGSRGPEVQLQLDLSPTASKPSVLFRVLFLTATMIMGPTSLSQGATEQTPTQYFEQQWCIICSQNPQPRPFSTQRLAGTSRGIFKAIQFLRSPPPVLSPCLWSVAV